RETILLTGLAGLLAGALSMGAGEYVSVRSQRELLAASTPSPETHDALADLDVDANELALVYRARGMPADEAARRAEERLAAAHRGAEPELHEAPDHEEIGSAWGAAISSFCFFASGALIPVLPYLLGLTGLTAVLTAAGLVGVALMVTGAIVGVLSGAPPLGRALRQLAIGWGASAAPDGLGLLFGTTGSCPRTRRAARRRHDPRPTTPRWRDAGRRASALEARDPRDLLLGQPETGDVEVR